MILKNLTAGMYAHREKNFGNGRAVKNLVEKLTAVHADRIAPILTTIPDEEKDLLTSEDCDALVLLPEYKALLTE